MAAPPTISHTPTEKGRNKSRKEEDRQEIGWNFLTNRYVQWQSCYEQPEHYHLNRRTNVILDLKKVAEQKLDHKFYLNIFLYDWYPKDRLDNTEHEKFLDIYWDTHSDRYLTQHHYSDPTRIKRTKKLQEVYVSIYSRYIPVISKEYQLRLGLKYQENINEYITLTPQDLDTLTPKQKAEVPALDHTRPWYGSLTVPINIKDHIIPIPEEDYNKNPSLTVDQFAILSEST